MSEVNVLRGEGTTTKQIKNAPENAVFVWCNNHIEYPKRLALDLGREDVRVVRKDWILRPNNYKGMRLEVVFDHAFKTERIREREAYRWLSLYINR
jgi:hypothetical protein